MLCEPHSTPNWTSEVPGLTQIDRVQCGVTSDENKQKTMARNQVCIPPFCCKIPDWFILSILILEWWRWQFQHHHLAIDRCDTIGNISRSSLSWSVLVVGFEPTQTMPTITLRRYRKNLCRRCERQPDSRMRLSVGKTGPTNLIARLE